MAGMNVEEKRDMCRFILDINDQFGTTIVLDRARHGRGHGHLRPRRGARLRQQESATARRRQVRNNQDVINAYLGSGH